MDKLKAISKALLFGLIMFAFLALSALIAKLMKLSPARTYVFQGAFMLLSAVVPLLYIGKVGYGCADVGLNKPTKSGMKSILFYIPLILCLIPIFIIDFKKSGSTKLLIVALFYYGCIAVASQIYFRGVVQPSLRGKMPVLACALLSALIFALADMHYLNHIISYKRNIILGLVVFAYAAVEYVIIENKGNILFTIIFNTLFFFIGTCFIITGKKMVIALFISCVVLLIYGIYMLVMYSKNNKPIIHEDFKDTDNIEIENTLEASHEE